MSDQQATPSTRATRLTRRHALGGVAGAGLGLPLLAACGSDSASTAADRATGGAQGGSGEAAPTGPFAATSEVPVGSGAVFADEGVVVTQPTEGEFVGFSITCTHQGCPVGSVTEDGIRCPCHGSVFDLATGAPTAGPASSPLAPVALDVQGGDISRA